MRRIASPTQALGCAGRLIRDHLERQGVSHAGITERTEPFPYAVLVFRDPDNVQLELIWY